MRTHQGVNTDEYKKSWSYVFEEMPKPEIGAGRSNSLFLKSKDEKFILKTLPHHIECFDNSNFNGSFKRGR